MEPQDPAASPLVTIGIPSFNCADHVVRAVSSALGQTYDHLEVLVIDDASTDATWDALSAMQDPRLQLIRNSQNLGAVANWNKVLMQARGQFIRLLHSDDFLEPDAISRHVDAMMAHPGVVLASSRRRVVDERDRTLTVRGPRWPSGARDGIQVIRDIARTGRNLIGEPSAVTIRSDALRSTVGFDADAGYVVDLDLWVRLLRLGDLYFIPDSLVAYRVRTGQWSVRLARSQAEDTCRLLEMLGSDAGLNISATEARRGRRAATRQALYRRLLYAALARLHVSSTS